MNQVFCSTTCYCWLLVSRCCGERYFQCCRSGCRDQSYSGPPFFNRVNIPVALLLLLLTGVGPLLAWRRTSMESLKRNFLALPVLVGLAAGILLVAGVGCIKPWRTVNFYSLMTMMLSVIVSMTVISEFMRGGRVIARHTGQNLFASMVQLTHRNTRRYGGYIVHFGVIVVVIGFAGSAFNQDNEHEMAIGQNMEIGPTRWMRSIPRTITRTTAANGPSWMCSRTGSRSLRSIRSAGSTKRASSRRVWWLASTLKEDLYLVYGDQPGHG